MDAGPAVRITGIAFGAADSSDARAKAWVAEREALLISPRIRLTGIGMS